MLRNGVSQRIQPVKIPTGGPGVYNPCDYIYIHQK